MNEDFGATLSAAKQGDAQALGDIWSAWQPSLLGYLRANWWLHAEDLASETWISVAKSLNSFQGDEAQFGAWLFKIARRRIADATRYNAARPVFSHAEPDADLFRDHFDTEEAVVTAQLAQAATNLIRRNLAPDQCDVLLLHLLAGLKPVQIAEVMNKSEGATRVLLHRGLRKLSAVVRQEHHRELFSDGV